jgi:hypothetical protein
MPNINKSTLKFKQKGLWPINNKERAKKEQKRRGKGSLAKQFW